MIKFKIGPFISRIILSCLLCFMAYKETGFFTGIALFSLSLSIEFMAYIVINNTNAIIRINTDIIDAYEKAIKKQEQTCTEE